ncbi:LytR/AlgR family response regulator transcription factor [Clostridium scatologenes]|uniref:Stage 0 sporulation protein A homolog n=1 Tax=Clostridium scatologenes TaxID=1548 RepID=A0A0E3K2M0_CLOSL|nr:LytTR family DNA-binding domain-containing protein [Clostridium scatologenes]AKA70920.1 DNA-binding response regulator [Clostridium scatologenes]
MMNIAVCDDDIEELKEISNFISKNIEELDIAFKIKCFNEGQDLIEYMNFNKDNFDIIFLDIYMKASQGIEIAKEIREFDKECKIIFITSSHEHAIDSYEVRALYYILKPINGEKFSTAIKLAIEELNKENKYIVIANKKGSYKIFHKDILYAESTARLVNLHLKSSEIITFYSKLGDFIKTLEDEKFIKVHKSFIVNMDYILKIEDKFIFIDNYIRIPISGVNLTKVKETYFNYLLKYT